MSRNGIIALVVGLVVVAGLAFAGWTWYQNDQDGDDANGTSEVANGDEEESEERHPEGWVLYENAEFGLSFAYPSEWGDVVTEQDEGVSGSAFSASFTGNGNVTLTGESVDYESIMGPSAILGSKGWGQDGDSYYFVSNGGQTSAGNAEEFEAWDGTGIYQVVSSPEAVYQADELHRVSFNLESSQYDGVVFMYRITEGQTVADYDVFRQVIESVEVK